MNIKRVDTYDDNCFSKEALLQHGAFLVDGLPYEVKIISESEAVVRGADSGCFPEVIEEFRFYTPHIYMFYDDSHTVLKEFPAVTLMDIPLERIQPSQFYVDTDKISAIRSFIHRPEDIIIQVMPYEDRYVSLDGHTRLYYAVMNGWKSVRAVVDTSDDWVFRFIAEAQMRNIFQPKDMKLLSHGEYEEKWNRFCNELFESKVTTMKIALSSAPVKNRAIEFNMQAMIDAIKKASGNADVILFGESVLQGFDCLYWDYETDKHMAVAITDAPIQRMREAAKQYGIAVSFGFIERAGGRLYSSQIFIGFDGEIVAVFHRVSVGWKEVSKTDDHYQEGAHFSKFRYHGKSFAIGLCGDLWTEGRPEEMNALNADVVLWPVWCDYKADEWNNSIKHEYAEQAALCGDCVLLVNPYCADEEDGAAPGGGVCFRHGSIAADMPAGNRGTIIVEV